MAGTKNHKPKKSIINKFVLLKEEDLIRKVEAKPILYDKSLKGYRKTCIRQQVWREVAFDLGDLPVEECRKRWRSLRDSFTKHYKLSLRLDAEELSKKKKWVFYDQMSFLAPYLDKSTYDTDRALLECFGDNSNSNDSDDEMRSDFIKPTEGFLEENMKPNEREFSLESKTKEHKMDEMSDISVVQSLNENKETEVLNEFDNLRTLNEINYDVNANANHTRSSPTFQNDNSDVLERNHVGACCTNNEIAVQVSSSNYDDLFSHACSDPDEKFLLSCLPALKRLSHRKNSLARLKIQKILYEVEFGSADDDIS